MTTYRKIYEDHFGPIPIDESGRTFEIHHIDGDHSNNSPENLKAVTIQEHYDIHYAQGDWHACLLIANRITITPEQKSNLARISQLRLVANGTHHFLGGKQQSELALKRVLNGTHHFLGGEIAKRISEKNISNGTHIFLKDTFQNSLMMKEVRIKNAQKQIANGTHPFLGGKIQSQSNRKRAANGSHPSQIKIICPHCGKIGGSTGMKTWHFDKCKFKS